MSIRCSAAVWRARLAPRLKLTALALADFADDDGGSIFPSVGTIAQRTGRTVRQERSNLSALCAAGVLVPETLRIGGKHPTRYRLNLDVLRKIEDRTEIPEPTI